MSSPGPTSNAGAQARAGPPAMFVWRDAGAVPAPHSAAGTPPAAAAPTPLPRSTSPSGAAAADTPAAFAPQSDAPQSAHARSTGAGAADAAAAAPSPPHVLDLLACHAADGRAAARKAAVQLVAVLVSLFQVAGCAPELQAASLQRGVPLLAALAVDTSVSVRLPSALPGLHGSHSCCVSLPACCCCIF